MGEIKALKDEVSSLKEQLEQLQDQLKDKDGLLQKYTKKRRALCKVYIECLAELTVRQAKGRRLDASLHQEPPQPETSWIREVEVEKENQALKEQVNLLKFGLRRLEDEHTIKNQLIMSETKKIDLEPTPTSTAWP
ncbi:unnamed protein product [Pleuronectes platessa]|uniref:Uncharacterized protein n=1 Tax=Pleuronectes platessa TaxID=8262 RepID=A0A9N7UEJ7_PLEPL|nr:unnamed protein product [Pleuronectes platessa]